MKIGILSLTSGYNFGGTLQSYALSKILENMGHDTTIIDYYPNGDNTFKWWRNWGFKHGFSPTKIREQLVRCAKVPQHTRNYNLFKSKYLKFTPACYNTAQVEKAISSYDAVIVGSDQVWNLGYHNDPVFYLEGMSSFRGLRLSYAACCGNPKQTTPNWVASNLEKFDSVCVRNSFTAEWVRRTTNNKVDPTVVVDPTLLLSDYPRPPLNLPEKYIATYHLGQSNPECQKSHFRKIRDQYGDIPIVCLMATSISVKANKSSDIILWNLDPFQWLETIRRASIVYTDSYHGILFALRNHVPILATYIDPIRSPRLIELREDLKLEFSIYQEDSTIDKIETPNWEVITKIFSTGSINSVDILSRMLINKEIGDKRNFVR